MLAKPPSRLQRLARPIRSLLPGAGLLLIVALLLVLFLPQINQIVIRPTQSLKPPTIPKLATSKPQKPTSSTPQTAPKQPLPAAATPAPASPAPKPVPVKTVPSSNVSNLAPSSSGSGASGSGSSGNSGSGNSGSDGGSSPVSYPPADYTSTNWSGYFAYGGSYTQVSADWVASTPTADGDSISADATWIGIGGITSPDLLQIGTDNTVGSGGQVTAGVFYEMLPDAAVNVLTMSISPGDTIQAAINESSTGEWELSITDLSNSQTFSTTAAYNSSLSSAEWIEEDPSGGYGNLIPLDDFGTVNISAADTVNNGTAEDLIQAGAYSVDMDSAGHQAEAATSAIGSDNASFSVEYQ